MNKKKRGERAEAASSSGSSSSGIRASVMPPLHMTGISEDVEAETSNEAAADGQSGGCSLLFDELTLTQMFEDGIEDASKEEDNDLM